MTADTEDFVVGDRVWVNGNKPGYIQFIGDTKFARGEWAGIVLDNYDGKNDGSIHGIRYFQCEPNRGIFARLYRLSRFPLDKYGRRLPDSGIIKRTRSVTPDRGYRSTITTNYSTSPSIPSYAMPTRPSQVYTKMTTTTTTVDDYDHNIRIGDKVVVHSRDLGMQAGRVRYVGKTSFSPGQWVGVQLDSPYGKNDGSVAGKRFVRIQYFSRLIYELFIFVILIKPRSIPFSLLECLQFKI